MAAPDLHRFLTSVDDLPARPTEETALPAALPEATTTDGTADEALVERLRGGDETAFDVLYARYFQRVYHFLDRRLRNRSDTEDTTQEVFVNVFASINSYRGEAPFGAWVFGLTRRTLANRFKRRRLATVALSDDDSEKFDLLLTTVRREANPLERYEATERLARLADAVHQELTQEQARLFELHHLQHCSIHDIARSLNKSVDAVKSNLYRARKVLMAR